MAATTFSSNLAQGKGRSTKFFTGNNAMNRVLNKVIIITGRATGIAQATN